MFDDNHFFLANAWIKQVFFIDISMIQSPFFSQLNIFRFCKVCLSKYKILNILVCSKQFLFLLQSKLVKCITIFNIKKSDSLFCWNIFKFSFTDFIFYFLSGYPSRYILVRSGLGVEGGKQWSIVGCCTLTFTNLNICNFGKIWTIDLSSCLFWVSKPSLVWLMLSCSWMGLAFVLIKGLSISLRWICEKFFFYYLNSFVKTYRSKTILKFLWNKKHLGLIFSSIPLVSHLEFRIRIELYFYK